MQAMTTARLQSRALIALDGETWQDWLQGLITQDALGLQAGQIRFGALLAPQGRLLHDLFLVGRDQGCWLDVAAGGRADLITRLSLYRLRAKIQLSADETPVWAAWEETPRGFAADPRLAGLGGRFYGQFAGDDAGEAAYDVHRLALGVPATADFGVDSIYPIEADFDLLNGIDFRKGCFVGQETTSRMKRRGGIRSRMAPITFSGPAPAAGSEILNGDLRAGHVLSGADGRAMALLRLDRAQGALSCDGRAVQVDWPAWLETAPPP
ncbi:MAG: aminomethyltransferase [Caulobacteraceae bacterium]|nr:aminomethyltransferase [Caulobacteraceae bacterium]